MRVKFPRSPPWHASLAECAGLNNYQHQFEVQLRFMILWLYWQYGTRILVILEAPTKGNSELSFQKIRGS